MKKTITLFIIGCMILMSVPLNAQLSFSQNSFLVKLPQSTLETPGLSDELRTEQNSIKMWSDDQLGIQLWQVQSFPYVTENGEVITNINESVMNSQEKTEIDGASLDYLTFIPSDDVLEPNCNQSDFKIYAEQGGTSVKISILDTGISEMQDNNQNGFDFYVPSYTGYDYVNEDYDPSDDNGHGSHLAGIIADIVNYSPSNNISYDIRKTHSHEGAGYISSTIRAIIDAVDAGADVINMSFSFNATGNMDGSILQTAIDYAESNDVLVVASAGNNAVNNDLLIDASYPATYNNENIISVASIDCAEELSTFSNLGIETVDVAILGEDIVGPDLSSGLAYKSGTSQATAIISGIAAVIATHQVEFDPSGIKCLLVTSSEYRQSLSGLITSEGIANIDGALELISVGGCDQIPGNYISESRSVYKIATSLYPNPTHDYINFDLPGHVDKSVNIRIIDANGRQVAEIQNQIGPSLQVGVNHLPSGSYHVIISGNNLLHCTPFIKF